MSCYHTRVRLGFSAVARVTLVSTMCILLTGCGRRGALEYPVNANDPLTHDLSGPSQSSGQDGQKVMRGYIVPNKTFTLDPLL